MNNSFMIYLGYDHHLYSHCDSPENLLTTLNPFQVIAVIT